MSVKMPRKKLDGRPVLLPVLRPGVRIKGKERDRLGVAIAEAVRSGESFESIAQRMNRSRRWVRVMVAEYAPASAPLVLRGDKKQAMARLFAEEYRNGATVDDLAAQWNFKRLRVLHLLADVGIDARAMPVPRPSPEWRLENLPSDILPADLDADPSDEEWVYILEFLAVRRAGGATIRALAAETGLSYPTVYRRLATQGVRPEV